MKYLLTSPLLLIFISIRAQSYLLQGKIGTFPVVMSITCDGNSCSGTYFYTSSLKDIPFEGGHIGPLYLLYRTVENYTTNKTDTAELLVLKQDGENWSGSWKSDDKQLPVSLAGKEASRDMETQYADKRRSLFREIKDSVVTSGKYKMQYYHLNRSGVYSFRITAGLGPAVAGRVNELLRKVAINNAEAFYTCVTPALDGEYDYSITNTFFSDNVISVTVNVSYDCGGAHPDAGEESYNIDAHTGALLELEDVLHLSNVPKPSKDSDNWYQYRSDIYAPKLAALLRSLYPKEVLADTANGCDYTNSEPWQFPDWHFTDRGLYINPDFPHVVAPCRDPEWSYIPYNVLRKYKNPAKNITLP